MLDPIAAELGIDRARANRLEERDGRLTGRSTGPVIDGAAKRDMLEALRLNLGVPRERVVAIGDGDRRRARLPRAHPRAAGLSRAPTSIPRAGTAGIGLGAPSAALFEHMALCLCGG